MSSLLSSSPCTPTMSSQSAPLSNAPQDVPESRNQTSSSSAEVCLPKRSLEAQNRSASYSSHPALSANLLELETLSTTHHPADIVSAYFLLLLSSSTFSSHGPKKLLSKSPPNTTPLHPQLPCPQSPTSELRLTLKIFYCLKTILNPSDLKKINPNSPLTNIFTFFRIKNLPSFVNDQITLWSQDLLPLKLLSRPATPCEIMNLGSQGERILKSERAESYEYIYYHSYYQRSSDRY